MIKNRIQLKTSYLSNCDLINKYKLINVEEIPSLSKVTLELSSFDIFSALEKVDQKASNSETKVKLFTTLYIFKLFQPSIHCDNDVKTKEMDKGFLLKVNFSTEKDINNLLTILFIENWSKSIFQSTTSKNKKFSCFKVKADAFFGIEKFLEQNLLEIDPSKLCINCRFIFKHKNLKNNVISIKMIKNIKPFWISC